MFELRGASGVAQAVGSFVFAHWDGARLTLGRDCTGSCPMFFHRGKRFVAFASDLAALLALPEVPNEIDELALAHFLAANSRLPRRTLYRGIERVPKRHLVTIDAAGVRHHEYWTPDFASPPQLRSFEDYVERGRELLDQAVVAGMRGRDRIAISLSGGLDSSALAATMARLRPGRRIPCYTLLPQAGYRVQKSASLYADEGEKVHALGRLYPSLDLQFFAATGTEDFDREETERFLRLRLPSYGPSGLGWGKDLRERLAMDGIAAVMTGVGGNFGLTWEGPMSLMALLRAGRFGSFASELAAAAKVRGVGLGYAFMSEVVLRGAPRPLRHALRRLNGQSPRDVSQQGVLNPAFVADHRLAEEWLAQGFEPWLAKYTGWQPAELRARLLFDYELASNHNAGVLDRTSGIDGVEPLKDRRLLEFCLQVPEYHYRRDGVGRAFARAVLADRLPPEIVRERRRGPQNTDWFRRLGARRAQIAAEVERLQSSATACRLLDLPRLKRLVDEWPASEQEAEKRYHEYSLALPRGVHVGRFIRWVEGGNG